MRRKAIALLGKHRTVSLFLALVSFSGAPGFIARVPGAGYLLFGIAGLIGSCVWGLRLLRSEEDYVEEGDNWRLMTVRRPTSDWIPLILFVALSVFWLYSGIVYESCNEICGGDPVCILECKESRSGDSWPR